MSRARSRPARLDLPAAPAPAVPTLPPSPAQLLERAKVAGRAGRAGGPIELRHAVHGLACGDRHAFGALTPSRGLNAADVWAAIESVFGATADAPDIDAARTLEAAAVAAARVHAVAAAGGRVALATSRPASLLPLFTRVATAARAAGGAVADLSDVGPFRSDGRTPRWLRWVDGVAVVTDGDALYGARDAEAAREWFFVVPRPALVVGDGAYAEVAWDNGVEVVAFAGLDRPGLAIAAARADRCVLVPMRCDRAPNAYGPIESIFTTSAPAPIPNDSSEL